MHRYIPVLLLLLTGLLVGCGDDGGEKEDGNDLAQFPSMACSIDRSGTNDGSMGSACNFQEQDCAEGLVCIPYGSPDWGEPQIEGSCAPPCNADGACPDGERCQERSWGRCDSGVLCRFDEHCAEWAASCNAGGSERVFESCSAETVQGTYCKGL